MFFNSLNKKLKKSYSVVNPEIGKLIFPNGEAEYIYVGTMLDTLFSKRDVFELIKIYASVYSYYQSTMGNTAKTYTYAKKKAGSMLSDGEIKNFVAFVMFNLTASKAGVSDPVAAVRQYRGFVDSYLQTVDGIKKNEWRFKPDTVNAGTAQSPLLVDGVCGVRDYIEALNVPGVEKITYTRTSSLHLTEESCGVSYAIDEYTLYNAANSTEIAKLWFNIYGTENTDVQPACFSSKVPFSVERVAPELFSAVKMECGRIEEIAKNAQSQYDRLKLVTATFAYFYVIWTFSFKGIRAYQCDEVETRFTGEFVSFIKQEFENAPYKAVLESETTFKDILKRVDRRVRNSYHNNNRTLVDDGLSTEFLMEFVEDAASTERIKVIISKRIMGDWVAVGTEADQKYLT